MLTALIITTIVAAAGAALQGYTNYQNNKAQESVAKYNAKVAENQAIQTQMEESVALDQQREDARRRIAAGRAAMAASGNVGPSSQGAELNALTNLDEDTAYTKWNYGSKADAFRSQAAIDRYSAKVYRGSAVNSLVAGGLNTIGAIGKGVTNMYAAGLIGGDDLVKDVNGNTLGRVGGYGSWGNP